MGVSLETNLHGDKNGRILEEGMTGKVFSFSNIISVFILHALPAKLFVFHLLLSISSCSSFPFFNVNHRAM